MTILHVGCGRKKLSAPALLEHVGLRYPGADDADVIHLDADAALQPDLALRLGRDRLPIEDNSIGLVIAWHVLEHIGRQGETTEWFAAFEELYRVLTPGGLIYAECPYYDGIWAWSDPTHARAISEHSFVFFNQDSYRVPGSQISPYRVRCDLPFAPLLAMPKGWIAGAPPDRPEDRVIRAALIARKPLRPWWADATADGTAPAA